MNPPRPDENVSPAPSYSAPAVGSTPVARFSPMQGIVRIPAKYEAHVRACLNDALRDIEEGLVPPFMIDDYKHGESVITITESVASRHPNQESAA